MAATPVSVLGGGCSGYRNEPVLRADAMLGGDIPLHGLYGDACWGGAIDSDQISRLSRW